MSFLSQTHTSLFRINIYGHWFIRSDPLAKNVFWKYILNVCSWKHFFFTELFILNPLKRAPTKSSLPGLIPVHRHVLRFLRESRVRFRDGYQGSSLTASNASALRSRLCYISWKKHVTCFNSDQSWSDSVFLLLVSDVFIWLTDECKHKHTQTHKIFF